MAAHADVRRAGSRGLLVRAKAVVARRELDRELAAGAHPGGRPELARRADVLISRRVRQRLAGALEDVVAEAAAAPPRERGAAAPIQRAEVLAAERDLLRLVAALRAEPAAPVRAIAAVAVLLSDGTGPVFAPYPRGALREAAFVAAFHAEAG
jgi:hypothetical protein